MKHLFFNPSLSAKSRALHTLSELEKCILEMEKAAEAGNSEMVKRWRVLCVANINHAQRFTTEILTIDDLADMVHENAKAHGWYDKRRSFGDVVALMHSELSEALEEYRGKKPLFYKEEGKPEGVATELVDCIIRILDTLRHKRVSVESVLMAKHHYNVGRPHRHGGKAL